MAPKDAIVARLDGAKNTLKLVTGPLETVPLPELSAAIATLVILIDKVKGIRRHRKDVDNLSQQISALTDVIERDVSAARIQMDVIGEDILHPHALSFAFTKSNELNDRVQHLKQLLQVLDSRATEVGSTTRLLRLFNPDRTRAHLQKMQEELGVAVGDLNLDGRFSILSSILQIFVGLIANAKPLPIESLPRADAHHHSAIHTARYQFLDGTQKRLLEELDLWVEGRTDALTDKRVYVLSGAAGTGKSTIASEFAKREEAKKRLGASFLFARGVDELSSTRLLISTLAYQLAHSHRTLYPFMFAAVRHRRSNGPDQDLEREIEDLLLGPLKKVPDRHPPVVIVLDALEECTQQPPRLVSHMLQLTLPALRTIPFPLRILLTVRSQEHIERTLRAPEFNDIVHVQPLDALPRERLDSDIHNLLVNSNLGISPAALDQLARLSNGSFGCARAIINSLHYHARPEEHLQLLLSMTCGSDGSPPLDRLYQAILDALPPETAGSVSAATILQWVTLLHDAISPRTMESLMGIPAYSTRSSLARLRPLILTEPAVLPAHGTLTEFLLDAERCTDPAYQVSRSTHEQALAIGCLETLLGKRGERTGVQLHLGDMGRSQSPAGDRNDLERVRMQIPAEVRYACVHWAAHLAASEKTEEACALLGEFARTIILAWVEALGYLRRLDVVAPALLGAREWLQVHGDVYCLLDECARFVKRHIEVIEADPEAIRVIVPDDDEPQAYPALQRVYGDGSVSVRCASPD